MSTVTEAPARHRPPRLRLARGGDPSRRPPRPGRASALAPGIADSHRPGQVGGRRPRDEPLVRRLRDAAPLLVRGRRRLLRQSLPRDAAPTARRAIEGEIAYSEFATDPCRSLFQRVSAMFSPKLTDNANVNLTKLGERFISMTETPIPVEFDAETLAAAGVPYDAAGTALHRPSAHGPRDQGDAELRGEARPADQLPVLPASPRQLEARGDRDRSRVSRARLHALLRAHRALARARRVPVRGQSAAARVQRPALHRELPLEARAGDAVPSLRPRDRGERRPVRDRGAVRLPPRQLLRGGRRGRGRHLHVPRTPQIVEDLYMERLRAGKPVAPAQPGALPDRARARGR